MMTSGKSIDQIILQYSDRGMDIIQEAYPVEHCAIAVEAFTQLSKGVVFLYTGFYVAGFAETDGPVGTYFLARTLNALGYQSIIITDEFCQDFFKEIDSIYIPLKGLKEKAEYEHLIDQYKPVAHISIERCGANSDGQYANMRGKNISEFTAPLDNFFVTGEMQTPTFAVGDGGNEIGMGNFQEIIRKELSLNPCIVGCDYPIIASVSNWGAYGFIACLEMQTQQSLLPTFPEVDAYLEYIVSLGSVDGVKAKNVKSVDGKDWILEAEILNALKSAVINHFNSFSMSADYDVYSKSQHNIGHRIIRKLNQYVTLENATCLDLGCGPGALTNALCVECEVMNLKVIGADIDKSIIEQARRDFPKCEFVVGSFYEEGPAHTSYDYIFANEALHWMPKIPNEFSSQKGIIYSFFGEEAQLKYRYWALSKMETSFAYIARNLGSIAVLQFGLNGQLNDVYALIQSVLDQYHPGVSQKIKFPLFYPTKEEVMELCKNNGLVVVESIVSVEDLTEKSREEIVRFIQAFTQNYLLSVMDKEEVVAFYTQLFSAMSDPEKIRKKQWQRMILVLNS